LDGRHITEILLQRQAELETAVSAASSQLFRLKNYIAQMQEGEIMKYQAIIKEIPKCIVFSARQTIPNYAALNALVPALGAKVAAANPGLKCAEPDYCFNIYHDGEYKESDIDVEICQAVTSFGKDGEGVVFKEMPAVTVASVLHKGGYDSLGAAYAFTFAWVQQNGYTVCGDPRESFIDGIWNKESEADWLTEIQVPVEKN
jgi:effector-binding domain-containing protein